MSVSNVQLHFEELAKSIFVQSTHPSKLDVRIHCANGETLKANKQILSLVSLLFRSIFEQECACATFMSMEYDIFCPDFDAKILRKVLESIHTGKTELNLESISQVKKINSILETFQIFAIFVVDEDYQSPISTIDQTSGDESIDVMQYHEELDDPILNPVEVFVKTEMEIDSTGEVSNFTETPMELQGQLKSPETNADNFPYFCSVCCKAFLHFSSLKRHTASGHGAKPFKCTQCPKGFSTKENLKNHSLSVHKGYAPYQCTDCDQQYSQSSNLKVHAWKKHNKQAPFTCLHCKKGFEKIAQLKNHLKEVHNVMFRQTLSNSVKPVITLSNTDLSLNR